MTLSAYSACRRRGCGRQAINPAGALELREIRGTLSKSAGDSELLFQAPIAVEGRLDAVTLPRDRGRWRSSMAKRGMQDHSTLICTHQFNNADRARIEDVINANADWLAA